MVRGQMFLIGAIICCGAAAASDHFHFRWCRTNRFRATTIALDRWDSAGPSKRVYRCFCYCGGPSHGVRYRDEISPVRAIVCAERPGSYDTDNAETFDPYAFVVACNIYNGLAQAVRMLVTMHLMLQPSHHRYDRDYVLIGYRISVRFGWLVNGFAPDRLIVCDVRFFDGIVHKTIGMTMDHKC